MNFLRRLTPLLILAVILLVFGFGLMLFFYLFLLSVAVSLVLVVYRFVKDRFFSKKPPTPKSQPKAGRVIDSDEWHHL